MVEVTDFKDDPLKKEGWQRRSILDEPRLSEVVKMYEDVGLEVLVTDFNPEHANGCKTCLECQPGKFKVVYTRPREGKGGSDDRF